MTDLYDPAADRDNDDWMYAGTPTAYARQTLVQRLVDNHELVINGRVVCNEAPLIVKGGLADGRVFLFRARHGRATLSVAWPDQDSQPGEQATSCPDLMSVDDTHDAANTFAQLMRLWNMS